MNDLRYYRELAWRFIKEWWSRSIEVAVAAIIFFLFGTAYQNKSITDDCKFMGSFRDGTQAYTCSQRVR